MFSPINPSSASTSFLVKLTNVLLCSGGIGALVAGPTWIFFMVRYGLLAGVLLPVIVAATVAWTTLAIVSVYAGLLRAVRPARFDRILSYMQVLLVTSVVAAPLLLRELEDRLVVVEVGTSPALYALPAAWFASACRSPTPSGWVPCSPPPSPTAARSHQGAPRGADSPWSCGQ
ncbi:hypothetical protein [Candidatus Palauibacter sp.]|uniref:hypothetical protein n=1 Tax=Candidatus Palauibacter sp. TaxID=3101350 RepID=UPI003B52E481